MSGQITQKKQYKKIITNLILTSYNKFVIVKGEVLYRIEFYDDERGISSIKDFITELNAKAKTDKTNKTPKSEIKKAKREIEDYKRRQDNDANLG